MIHVRFTCDDPPTDLVVLLGPERPDVSSGYGGWEEVERPRRSTVTTWKGQPARRMSLNVVIDHWQDNDGVACETEIRRLERMALPRPGGEPPTVEVAAKGGVIPPYLERLTWVIDAISWGDALANENWNRVRQFATVTLLEYVSDELIERRRSPAKRQRAKRKGKTGSPSRKGAKRKRAASKGKHRSSSSRALSATQSVVQYDGEDLLSLAARELGDARRWPEIAVLNGIRDPRAITRGQVIRLP